MLVIHPKDKTTAMLAALCEGEQVRLLDQTFSKAEINHHLHHTSRSERIMLLGHGSDKGLFSRDNDEQDLFDRLLVYHPHAYFLRKHGSNIVALWCNADLFARKEGLHGLFSGMIISELNEALAYEVPTTQNELNEENVKLARRLRTLLDESIPLNDIPQRMFELNDTHTPLTDFNYSHFYYL